MATWTVVLEFLPFTTVVLAKSVSKELRSAARLALTTGRCKDITRSLKLVSRVGALRRDDRGGACDAFTEEERATIRRGWSMAASIVGVAVQRADWYPSAFSEIFFGICEPTHDGLERIVAAMQKSDVELFFRGPFWRWVRHMGPLDLITVDLITERVWAAVGKWRNADRCFEALKGLEGLESEEKDPMECAHLCDRAARLTASWKDKVKAQHVIDGFQAFADELEEQFREDYEAEHGWKYEGCPPGVKFWEMDDYDPGDESPPTD